MSMCYTLASQKQHGISSKRMLTDIYSLNLLQNKVLLLVDISLQVRLKITSIVSALW